jgi:histidinol-phosphate/aromatic aminotransferase/cobyric acid decarboxylase-like protein
MKPLLMNCYHGGAFFDAIGAEFNHLDRRHTIINADVLDAWFDPAPQVIAALTEELPWLLRTSPPTHAEGMVRVIARTRDVPETSILPGAGSSDLIFLALREWLTRDSRVLILDPMYGEYAHVLEAVVECHVDRLPLERENNYRVDLEQLTEAVARDYDLIILVNPNSPTGQHIPRSELEIVLRQIPTRTRVWVDETYVEYAGADQSLEPFAATSQNVVVCKSLSKVYALSGLRAAYLCGPASSMAQLREVTPPWAVSLPAQVAAVTALQAPEYYAARWAETHRLRAGLQAKLTGFAGWKIIPGVGNSILCHLPTPGPSAAEMVRRCRFHGLYVRDVGSMGQHLGDRALRIAVKEATTNSHMVQLLQAASAAPVSARQKKTSTRRNHFRLSGLNSSTDNL